MHRRNAFHDVMHGCGTIRFGGFRRELLQEPVTLVQNLQVFAGKMEIRKVHSWSTTTQINNQQSKIIILERPSQTLDQNLPRNPCFNLESSIHKKLVFFIMNVETGNLMYAMVVLLQHNVDFDGLACTDQFLVKKKARFII